MKITRSHVIRSTMLLLMIISIVACYVAKIVQSDYVVLVNDDGLPSLDEWPMQTVIDPLYCSWDTSSKLLIFSDNVFGNFVYYSHLLPVVCVAAFIILLLTQNRRDPVINSLVVIAIAFTCWSFTDLVLWATANSDYTMFFWSIIIHFELLIYFGALFQCK